MGQRLNIEIKSKGKIIANCYYHWSAFSEEALKLTRKIIENFNLINDENDVLKAIRLLGTTGAGVTRECVHYMYKNIPNFDLTIEDGKEFGKYLIPLATSRNNGLIEVSEERMAENRYWEEGRVTIDIENKTFDFDVVYEIDDKEEIEEIKDKLKENEKISNLLMNGDFKLKNIPFAEIDNYIKIEHGIEANGGYFKINDTVYEFIF